MPSHTRQRSNNSKVLFYVPPKIAKKQLLSVADKNGLTEEVYKCLRYFNRDVETCTPDELRRACVDAYFSVNREKDFDIEREDSVLKELALAIGHGAAVYHNNEKVSDKNKKHIQENIRNYDAHPKAGMRI